MTRTRSAHREDDPNQDLHTHGDEHGWMAVFEEDLRRMHLERLKPRALTSLLRASLRQWLRRTH